MKKGGGLISNPQMRLRNRRSIHSKKALGEETINLNISLMNGKGSISQELILKPRHNGYSEQEWQDNLSALK